jgi:phosphopantothenoylcysteine decarboxylase/phosphopantothenate--cysteine ligase
LPQIALAYDKTILIAPSANTKMIQHTTTQASLKMLKLNNYKIIKSQSKLLACGDEGDGAMADVNEIYHQSIKELNSDEYWVNRRVVVSSGGVIEKIDDVRYISNFSSGIMGSNLALALYYMGADVCLISTKPTDLPLDIHVVDVQNSTSMLEYLTDCIRVAKKGIFIDDASLIKETQKGWIKKKPYLFMVAAVSDFVPAYPQNGKIKKDTLEDEWNLKLIKNIDILSSIKKDDIFAIGFKAEMDQDSAFENAKSMLVKKSLYGVVLNILKDDKSFATQTNEIELILKNNTIKISKDTKLNISLKLLKSLKDNDRHY